MGSLVGRIGEESPKFQVLHVSSRGYEVRSYNQSVLAITNRVNEDGRNYGFKTLARYIGVMGTPENEKREAISMTVPVGISSDESKMWFYLPASRFESAAAAPKPIGSNVKIATELHRTEAVMQFSGAFNHARCAEKATELLAALEADDVAVNGEWFAAAYNPPWTLNSCRTNEVHVPLAETELKLPQVSPRNGPAEEEAARRRSAAGGAAVE